MVAARLSEDPSVRVALPEAGSPPPPVVSMPGRGGWSARCVAAGAFRPDHRKRAAG